MKSLLLFAACLSVTVRGLNIRFHHPPTHNDYPLQVDSGELHFQEPLSKNLFKAYLQSITGNLVYSLDSAHYSLGIASARAPMLYTYNATYGAYVPDSAHPSNMELQQCLTTFTMPDDASPLSVKPQDVNTECLVLDFDYHKHIIKDHRTPASAVHKKGENHAEKKILRRRRISA